MKASGKIGSELISQLVENSESFQKKTKFSQAKFLKKKAKRKPIRVLLESTGNYGLDLALELNERKRVEVVYINPRVASAFAKAAGLRAKTDTVDALMLAAMCANGHGRTWAPPAPHLRQLRAATRRIRAMVNTRTAEKNRLKALLATTTTPTFVREEVELSIQHLTARITLLRKHTLHKIKRK